VFLRTARIAALAAVATFVASIGASWAGLVPEQWRSPLAEATFIPFFGCVAVYFVAYGIDFSRPFAEDTAPLDPADPGERYEAADRKASLTWKSAAAAELFIVASLMSILVFGVLGSLVSDGLGVAGTAVGGVLTLIAVGYYIVSAVRMFRARKDLWIQMGRRRWQFVGYTVALFVAVGLAGLGRYLYHAKIVTGGAIVLGLLLLIRVRTILRDLW
jgi:hypothetical protein